MKALIIKPYSNAEERLNALTHGSGFILAVFGLFYLVVKSADTMAVVSAAIYGSSLVLMFLTSTFYHSISEKTLKSSLKLLDHSAIYLLIAGTYTPFMLVALNDWRGIVGISIIWSIALFGLFFKWNTGHKYPKLSVSLYLVMGWLIVIFLYPLSKVVPANALWLLLAGGVFFSVGVLFYIRKSVAYTHAIWHCFVMAGCACHFFSIYYYIL